MTTQTKVFIALIICAIIGIILLSIYISPWFATSILAVIAMCCWWFFIKKDDDSSFRESVNLYHTKKPIDPKVLTNGVYLNHTRPDKDFGNVEISELSTNPDDMKDVEIINKLNDAKHGKSLITSDEFDNIPAYVTRTTESKNVDTIIHDVYIHIIRNISCSYGYIGTMDNLYKDELLDDDIVFSYDANPLPYDKTQVAIYKSTLLFIADTFRSMPLTYTDVNSIANYAIPLLSEQLKKAYPYKPIYYILLKNAGDMFKYVARMKDYDFNPFNYIITYNGVDEDNFNTLLNHVVFK